MTKTAAQLDREIAQFLTEAPAATPSKREIAREAARLIAGDAELEGKPDVGKAIRKRYKAGGARLLGYTESGKPVNAPIRPGVPDTNNVVVFKKTKARFPGWSEHDFMDAAALYDQASEAALEAGEYKLSRQLKRWTSIFWDIGGRWTGPEYEARHGTPDRFA